MATKTGIEWTDATWNPVRGCSKVSEGCRNCYAMGTSARWNGEGQPYEGIARIGGDGKPHWTGVIKQIDKALRLPLSWREPKKIFVNSMSDLFHEGVTEGFIRQCFGVMAMCPQHTFQILTKRPKRMLEVMSRMTFSDAMETLATRQAIIFTNKEWVKATGMIRKPGPWPLPNVWVGTSVEDQKAADERIPLLLQVPAVVRFLSCEPLLGQVEICNATGWKDAAHLLGRAIMAPEGLHTINWIIAGGESGQGARPMHPAWARKLRDLCINTNVPFFFKQWGEIAPMEEDPDDNDSRAILVSDNGVNTRGRLAGSLTNDLEPWERDQWMRRVGKKAAGRMLDGREWSQFPTPHGAKNDEPTDAE